jgi:hypothetical protein
MQEAAPLPPPDDGEYEPLLDEVVDLGSTEPELLVRTHQTLARQPRRARLPEARTTIEAYMRSLGVPEEHLMDTSLTIAPCRNRPAIASLTCPTPDVTDTLLPVAAGERLDTTFTSGLGRYGIAIAFAGTDAASAMLAPPRADAAGAPLMAAPAADRHRLVLFQDFWGTVPQRGAQEEQTREACRSFLERSMRSLHQMPTLAIEEPPTWARARADGKEEKKGTRASLMYIITTPARLKPLAAYKFGCRELQAEARAATSGDVRRQRLSDGAPRNVLRARELRCTLKPSFRVSGWRIAHGEWLHVQTSRGPPTGGGGKGGVMRGGKGSGGRGGGGRANGAARAVAAQRCDPSLF